MLVLALVLVPFLVLVLVVSALVLRLVFGSVRLWELGIGVNIGDIINGIGIGIGINICTLHDGLESNGDRLLEPNEGKRISWNYFVDF